MRTLSVRTTQPCPRGLCSLPDANDQTSVPPPPHWAVAQAHEEAEDGEPRATTIERARQLKRDAEQLDEERHDQYDDPDEGGEG
jgi:hypothetical protein